MTWVERNPELIAKIRVYISEFQSIKPTLFEYFEGGRSPVFPVKVESDRGIALLLCYCALYQNISEARLVRFLHDLWQAYGSQFFKLNRLPFEDLQNQIRSMKDLEEWVLWSKAPGILRSLCDFFYKHGALLPWIRASQTHSDPISILCDEIFLMGKTSELKNKPRYFLWLLTQLPNAKPEDFWNEQMLVPITPGQVRFLFDFGPLKGKSSPPWLNSAERLTYCNRFYRMLMPGKPWMVYTAFDAYLKSTRLPTMPLEKPKKEKIWSCRLILKGCLNCNLAPDCQGCEVI